MFSILGIVTHVSSINHAYITILNLVEKTSETITNAKLATVQPIPTLTLDWEWLNAHVWTTMSYFVDDTVLARRLVYTNGEDWNGLELWRALYIEGKGGSTKVNVTGQTQFHNFPQCKSIANLQIHVGQWLSMRLKYGNGIPEEHLRCMFLGTLPESVSADIRRRDHIVSLQQCLDYIAVEVGHYNDERLSKVQSQRMTKILTGSTPGRPLNALMSEESDPFKMHPMDRATMADQGLPPPTQHVETRPQAPATMPDLIETLVAALNNRPAPKRGATQKRGTERGTKAGQKDAAQKTRVRPNPAVRVCWHCGSEDHRRGTGCASFQKFIKDNGGQVPKGYVGKFEQKKTTRAAALTDEENDEDGEFSSEDEEGVVWGHARVCLSSRPVTTRNGFSALSSIDEEEDEEEEMVKALSQISSKITIGPKPTQSSVGPRKLNKTRITEIASAIKTGVLRLPAVETMSDDDFYEVLCLVDSGAGANTACKKKHFPSAVHDSSGGPVVKLKTASGEVLPSRGRFAVSGLTDEGHEANISFVDADVDMPIISVGQLAKEGKKGTDVSFSKRGGTIRDTDTGRVTRFIKKQGVYFIRLRIRRAPMKDIGGDDIVMANMDFVRPALP